MDARSAQPDFLGTAHWQYGGKCMDTDKLQRPEGYSGEECEGMGGSGAAG